ncbi:MAG: signal peptidase II [Acidobacteria bacterium]|nr:signal peptidase II [Acidobacteriota bacterium]MBI3472503.1 signal peptidase II [Candidatus Solibacter usitatus]
MTPPAAYGLAAAVFALDRLTKWLIETRVSVLDAIPVIPGFFDIVHARNRGAAFSLLAESDSPWRPFLLIGVSLAALALVGGMLRKAQGLERNTALGLSLILGGAFGNVFDRIVTGAVTDFLDFYIGALHWPSFNVADSAIVVGSGFLLLDLLRPKRQAART